MHRPAASAFTRADLLAAVVVVITFIGVSHALLGDESDNKISNRERMANTHARGIHSGLVLYAQGNKDYYPGLNANGEIATLAIPIIKGIAYGTDSKNGAEPLYRMAVMLRGNFFAPSYLLNPFEDKRKKSEPTTDANMTTDNFSYAMLRIDDTKNQRVGEWKATNNSRAVVVSDRNIGKGAGKDARSVSKSDGWQGVVIFNDNHAEIVKNPLKRSDYNLRGEVADDDLFAEDKNEKGEEGADAAMVYHDAKTYVDQK